MFRKGAETSAGWLAVPLNLRTFIHRSWQMFPFVNDEQLQLAGARWRAGAAIFALQDSVGGVSINHGAA